MDEIIRKVAEQYGVTTDEVRREMQAAVDAAWANRTDEKPSLEEFVTTLVRCV